MGLDLVAAVEEAEVTLGHRHPFQVVLPLNHRQLNKRSCQGRG